MITYNFKPSLELKTVNAELSKIKAHLTLEHGCYMLRKKERGQPVTDLLKGFISREAAYLYSAEALNKHFADERIRIKEKEEAAVHADIKATLAEVVKERNEYKEALKELRVEYDLLAIQNNKREEILNDQHKQLKKQSDQLLKLLIVEG
jgi:hypothetical protein